MDGINLLMQLKMFITKSLCYNNLQFHLEMKKKQ